MPVLGATPVRDIGRMQIQTLLSGCATYKVAKNARDLIRQILGEALQMEIIRANPACGRYKLPEKRDTDKSNSGEWVTTTSEQQAVISIAPKELRPVLVLGFCFGLRKGEILGLDWQDVDFAKRTISVRKAYIYTKGGPEISLLKTEQSRRVIPMSAYAYAQLKSIRQGIDRIGSVCTSSGKRMLPSAAKKLMHRFTSAHDVPKVTCHSLRHSFATTAILSGVPVELVSKMLGHTNITTTYNRYVKPLQGDLMGAVEILNRAYGGTF